MLGVGRPEDTSNTVPAVEFICKIGYSLSMRERSRIRSISEGSVEMNDKVKVVGTEISQETTAFALEIVGASSTLFDADKNAPDGGQWPHEYLNSYAGTIAAGTSEIQRNQLGDIKY